MTGNCKNNVAWLARELRRNDGINADDYPIFARKWFSRKRKIRSRAGARVLGCEKAETWKTVGLTISSAFDLHDLLHYNKTAFIFSCLSCMVGPRAVVPRLRRRAVFAKVASAAGGV